MSGDGLVAFPHTGRMGVLIWLACGHARVAEWPVRYERGRYFDAERVFCYYAECGEQDIMRVRIVLT